MRICVISKFIPPVSTDGIPRTRWEYARQFTLLGHEVHIITSGFKGMEKLEEGIFIHEIPAWDQEVFSRLFSSLQTDDICRNLLCYSYLVYERIKKLHKLFPIDIIDSPLWDIEGYITRLNLPNIPMVVRMETTTMLLREILQEKKQEKNYLNEIETHFMEMASGIVFDSWSILEQTERLYHFNFNVKPYSVIHHGIDISNITPLPPLAQTRNPAVPLKILIAGRLEKRKGSDLLVNEVLPAVLQKTERVEFHIAGKDSGQWDGFKDKNGVGYHDFIRKNFKKYINKQIFLYGYVKDEELEQLYQEADIVLVLSKYESFGLLYLEAMYKGKALIALKTGAVPEIFENGETAILIPPESPEEIADEIIRLNNDPALRHRLASNAMEKLKNDFSSALMAKKCIGFFKELVFHKKEERVFQVMNCLTDKDGVSNTVIDYDTLLKQQVINTQILSTWTSEPVKHLTREIESVQFRETDYVIYHYWNYCERADFFNKLVAPKKIFLFHNITPSGFFQKDDDAYKSTSRGFEQLHMFDNFDIYVCHTEYSANILRQAIARPINTYVIPPVIDREKIMQRKYDKLIAVEKHAFTIAFVGSIAPHKKQTDIVRFFHYYLRHVDPTAVLLIIGGGSAKYVEELAALVKTLKITQQVKMTGKVPNEELYGYYRAIDVFLSMSEHEGFGVPLAEAMSFQVPVVAYRCTAIPNTVGENGCLFPRKDFALIARIVEKLKDPVFRKEVVEKQNEHLGNFSPESISGNFEKLKELAYSGWHKRISEKMLQGQLLTEDTILYNDDRLMKNGLVRIMDDSLLFLEPNSADSSLYVQDDFQDFEISFLVHQWSGKVVVTIDEEYEEEFDLYSADRKFKTVKLSRPIKNGKHLLYIKPAGNRNELSSGNEVLVEKITLKKQFGLHATMAEELKLVENGNHDNDLSLAESEEDTGSVHEFNEQKFLRFVEEIPSSHDSISYSPEWARRDKFFHFVNGKSSNDFFEFKGQFSVLDLIFLTHGWSGKIVVQVDGKYTEILNLYNPQQDEHTFRLNKVFAFKEHHVVVKAAAKKDNRSRGFEVFFKGIIVDKKIELEIPEDRLMHDYRVSVVINTLNRASHLKSLLAELEKQTYPFFEIVVVNGPSTDNTSEVLQLYSDRIKIISCPEANLSMSRNLGIENAAGNYIAFIDDDALPCNENWLENFVHFLIYYSDRQIGAIGGPVKHRDTQHFEFKNGVTSDYGLQVFRDEELKDYVLDGKRWVQGVPGGNNIVSKKALYDIGGFDERFIYYLDETDMCMQLARKGYFIANNPVNYIRHFKAISHNRKSTYEIKWDIIARSDAFYSMKNGYDAFPVRLIKVLARFRHKHFVIELKNAYRENKIDKKDYDRYRKLLTKGFWQGIRLGIFQPRHVSYLKKEDHTFLRFFNVV